MEAGLIPVPLVHASLLPVSALTISNIQPGFTGTWECRVRTSRGNTTRTVHIVVLETSAKYCAPERVGNNRGEFRLVLLKELLLPLVGRHRHYCLTAAMLLSHWPPDY